MKAARKVAIIAIIVVLSACLLTYLMPIKQPWEEPLKFLWSKTTGPHLPTTSTTVSPTALAKETEAPTLKTVTTASTKKVTPAHPHLPARGEWIVFKKEGKLYAISSDGKVLKCLDAPFTSFAGSSPTGDRIAIVMPGKEGGLTILNPDGTGRRVVDKHYEGSIHNPTILWSPDGGKIAYLSDENYLYVVNVDGSGRVKIGKVYSSQAGLHHVVWNVAAWSPDGKKIAYLSSGGNLYVADPDGKSKHRLDTRVEGKFGWGAKGRVIAYRKRNYTLYVIKADGSGRIKLAEMDMFRPDDWFWSPKGSALAYIDSSGALRMSIFDEDGNLLRTILLGTGGSLFGFSSSGKYLAFWNFSLEYSYLQILDLETGSLTTLDGKRYAFISWSPAEDKFLCLDEESGDVIIMSPEGEVKATIVEPDKFFKPKVKWFPSGKKIAFRISVALLGFLGSIRSAAEIVPFSFNAL